MVGAEVVSSEMRKSAEDRVRNMRGEVGAEWLRARAYHSHPRTWHKTLLLPKAKVGKVSLECHSSDQRAVPRFDCDIGFPRSHDEVPARLPTELVVRSSKLTVSAAEVQRVREGPPAWEVRTGKNGDGNEGVVRLVRRHQEMIHRSRRDDVEAKQEVSRQFRL